MAFLQNSSIVAISCLYYGIVSLASCNAYYHNNTIQWLPATATWYGSANGDGSDGGACGYGSLSKTPYGLLVGAVSPILFRDGKGCGACYQVKCVHNYACSGHPVRVVITDECPGGYCSNGATHFDLSGKAFSRMAQLGKASSLRNAGVLPVLFRRTRCSYGRNEIGFQIGEGATAYWLEVLVRYEDGDGDLSTVELMQEGWKWAGMRHVWGAYWCMNNYNGALHGPLSFRLTSSSGRILTAYNAIPFGWEAGRTYVSHVNF